MLSIVGFSVLDVGQIQDMLFCNTVLVTVPVLITESLAVDLLMDIWRPVGIIERPTQNSVSPRAAQPTQSLFWSLPF